ncbi:MAG TPA: glycosyltransferase family 39 protein [Acidimicrobiales bacterium]|nr:glycosyltransferase family 39 protein [Acidimicrobiales bacterium]
MAVSAIGAAAGAGPAAWILTHRPPVFPPLNDAWYYQWQARYLVDGVGWFVSPSQYAYFHVVMPSAQHPPLWTLMLALADTLGLTTFLGHILVTCAIGAAAVVVTAVAARRVAGPVAGMAAAVMAAVYPNYWLNDFTGLPEMLTILMIAGVVWASFRFWHDPSMRTMAVLGILCGLAAATRAEQTFLVVCVLVPLALVLRGVPLRRRLGLAALGTAMVVVVIGPWIGYNLSRFERTVFMSDDFTGALASANCHQTYYGNLIGYFSFACLAESDKHVHGGKVLPGDESVQDTAVEHVALRYMTAHQNRLPLVVAARLGREFGLFDPWEQVKLDAAYAHRSLLASRLGLLGYYVLLAGAVAGGVVLRRRRVTLVPFLGVFVLLVVTTAATFGSIRYRAPLEAVLVILAAVAVAAAAPRLRRGGRTGVVVRADPAPAPATV